MTSLIKYILGFFVAILMLGCKPAALSPEAFIAYANDPANGLVNSQEFGDFIITAYYRPPGYEVARSLYEGNSETDEALAGESGTDMFMLRIAGRDSKTDALSIGANDEQYAARIRHLISGIESEIVLVEGTDTIACTLHHYPRGYRLVRHHDVMLAFDHPQHEEPADKLLIYDDNMLGIGRVILKISKEAIEDIPEIKL